jgi:hypothetical protein
MTTREYERLVFLITLVWVLIIVQGFGQGARFTQIDQEIKALGNLNN